jgi:SAM-dependent methyltransferase
MPPELERVGRVRLPARRGYDLWAPTYDTTPNPVVAMDRRWTLGQLRPQAGERILDAGCGTGGHLPALAAAGARAVGADLSLGMLTVARRSRVPLAALDLEQPLPFPRGHFDAVLSALIGEHVRSLEALFRGFAAVLRPGGRLVFSTYHPWMAEAGKEAHFVRDGQEYGLGAEPHTVADFLAAVEGAGLTLEERLEPAADTALLAELPTVARYEGRPLLLVLLARRAAGLTP